MVRINHSFELLEFRFCQRLNKRLATFISNFLFASDIRPALALNEKKNLRKQGHILVHRHHAPYMLKMPFYIGDLSLPNSSIQ